MFLDQLKNNTEVKIILKNNKIMKGFLIAYDIYMNIILDDCEEYKQNTEKKNWDFRRIGFCIIRGDMIILISKETQ